VTSRAGDIQLLILTLLIALSPLLWFFGIPLDKVVIADVFWLVLWLVTAIVGQRYER